MQAGIWALWHNEHQAGFKNADKRLEIDCSHACTVVYLHYVPSSLAFEVPEFDKVLNLALVKVCQLTKTFPQNNYPIGDSVFLASSLRPGQHSSPAFTAMRWYMQLPVGAFQNDEHEVAG